MTGAATWQDALAALALFAVDPAGLQGIVLRSPAGPVRDRFLALLRGALPPGAAFRRMPPGIDDDRLLGGLDLAVTLQAGRPVAQRGLLAEADGGVVVLAMAERIEPGAAARLCAALDTGAVGVPRDGLAPELPARFGLVALDEGIAPDEAVPNCLLDRTAFHVDLSGIAPRDMADAGWTHADLATGRQRLNDAATPVDAPEVPRRRRTRHRFRSGAPAGIARRACRSRPGGSIAGDRARSGNRRPAGARAACDAIAASRSAGRERSVRPVPRRAGG
jgi:magnesium chelatase subunit D